MARIRSIKPDFFCDEKLTECSLPARFLFIGLLCFVDDEGVMVYSPKRVKMLVFPGDSVDVEPLIAELTQNDRVVVYEAEKQRFLWIRHFSRHQHINRKSKWRAGPLPDESLTTHDVLTECSLQGEGKGTGNGEGKGEVKEPPPIKPLTEPSVSKQCVPTGTFDEVPDDLHPLNYAARICHELVLPEDGNLRPIAGSIEALMKTGKSKVSAYTFLLAKALDARDSGEAINAFWFRDGKYNAAVVGQSRNDRVIAAYKAKKAAQGVQ